MSQVSQSFFSRLFFLSSRSPNYIVLVKGNLYRAIDKKKIKSHVGLEEQWSGSDSPGWINELDKISSFRGRSATPSLGRAQSIPWHALPYQAPTPGVCFIFKRSWRARFEPGFLRKTIWDISEVIIFMLPTVQDLSGKAVERERLPGYHPCHDIRYPCRRDDEELVEFVSVDTGRFGQFLGCLVTQYSAPEHLFLHRWRLIWSYVYILAEKSAKLGVIKDILWASLALVGAVNLP